MDKELSQIIDELESIKREAQTSFGQLTEEQLNWFATHQSEVAEHMKSTDGIDLHKTIITSPIASFITYSLFNAYQIIVAHEQRHLAQAKRVVERQELWMKDEG